jgi:hypothetical protein
LLLAWFVNRDWCKTRRLGAYLCLLRLASGIGFYALSEFKGWVEVSVYKARFGACQLCNFRLFLTSICIWASKDKDPTFCFSVLLRQ